ncbi:uncharacterized protein BJ171DRAFT_542768 [Polychytrium aggregatum]|uniref:uncharacterized protein n=1 Tax=Polychytrium aggregatum TaxID=110093 RepID=UPI0022FE6C32|nr:uncharacterized protein BJ171DRAFT_542768 [Polychytrium aggregatum]KAI9190647.1 hypothetical protein BJ171DRAFT_542768 [Polychytrium aggregatum]
MSNVDPAGSCAFPIWVRARGSPRRSRQLRPRNAYISRPASIRSGCLGHLCSSETSKMDSFVHLTTVTCQDTAQSKIRNIYQVYINAADLSGPTPKSDLKAQWHQFFKVMTTCVSPVEIVAQVTERTLAAATRIGIDTIDDQVAVARVRLEPAFFDQYFKHLRTEPLDDKENTLGLIKAMFSIKGWGAATKRSAQGFRTIKALEDKGHIPSMIAMIEHYIAAEKYINVFELSTKLAAKGNIQGHHFLGWTHFHGKGTPQNYTLAVKHFNIAVGSNHRCSQKILGDCHFYGLGVAQSYQVAFAFYLCAGLAGDPEAAFQLGELYKNGLGIDTDVKSALLWYDLASNGGNIDACRTLGEIYLTGTIAPADATKAVKLLQTAADAKDPKACYLMGEIYHYGRHGVERDYTKATPLFHIAALSGQNSDAEYIVGYLHENGIGSTKDLRKAVYWYKKSANNDNPNGRFGLARMMLKGAGGIKKNVQGAIDTLVASAAQGHPGASYVLGTLWETKAITEPGKDNYQEAIHLFTVAANGGYHEAQARLGNIYFQGDRVSVDFAKAFKLLLAASDSDEDNVIKQTHNLGECYLHGFGVRRDVPMAIVAFERAANAGNTESQYQLGVIHTRPGSYGWYTDYNIAAKWLTMASTKNHAEAQFELAELHFYGRGMTEPDTKTAIVLYQKAVDNNCEKAQFILGFRYSFGANDIPKDPSTGLEYLKQAHARGHSNATAAIGMHHYYGTAGCTKDCERALTLFNDSAARGSALGHFWVGMFFYGGVVVDQNFDIAYSHFTKAACMRFAPAFRAIARYHELGLGGFPVCLLSARDRYRTAARLGDTGGAEKFKALSAQLHVCDSFDPIDEIDPFTE